MDAVISSAVRAIGQGGGCPRQHEVEARLGSMEGDRFVPGVNPEWFKVLLHRLELCTVWSAQEGWQESEDTTFTAGGRQVRQSRICNTKDCRIDIQSVHKERKASACVPLGASRGDSAQDPFHMIPTGVDTMRISYSTEIPVNKLIFPDIVLPTYVRIKQRRSFVLESSALEGAGWRFDLSRTWSGCTREAAEQSQHNSPPVCEVELEWVPPMNFPLPIGIVDSLSSSFSSKMSALL